MFRRVKFSRGGLKSESGSEFSICPKSGKMSAKNYPGIKKMKLLTFAFTGFKNNT